MTMHAYSRIGTGAQISNVILMTIKEQLILILIQLKANQFHAVYRECFPFTHAMGLTTETNYLVSAGNKSLAKNYCAQLYP